MEAGVVPWVAQRSELDHNMSKQVIAGQRQFCVCVCVVSRYKRRFILTGRTPTPHRPEPLVTTPNLPGGATIILTCSDQSEAQ